MQRNAACGLFRRLRKMFAGKARKSARSEAYFSYAATTKDAAQRSMRTFYEVVNLDELVKSRF
jgi:hypothetical protein